MPPEQLTRALDIEVRGQHGGKSYTATLSTETPVFRRGRDGEYNEVLSHDPKAVNLERSPLPLIERHDSDTMPIGLVENIRIVDRKLKGSIRFGSSERAKEIEADVEAGIIRNLSVGYSIDEIEERKGNGTRTLVATRWTPHEVSALAIGADANAGFGRNFKKENKKMENIETLENTTTVADPILAERKRAKDIAIAVRTAKIESSFSDNLINQGTPIDEARTLIFAEMYKRDQAEEKPRGSINVAASRDIGDSRSGFVDQLVQSKGRGIINVARDVLAQAGVSGAYGMSSDKLIKRAMSVSDFTGILADTADKTLRAGYEDEPSTHRQWVSVSSVRDFKTVSRPVLGAAPGLSKVLEGGAYPFGSMDDATSSYKVEKYGKILKLTYELLKNDDLGAFLRLIPALGQAARRKEADVCYDFFAENAGLGPTMAEDAKALFHADHKNITTGGSFNAALLAAGRLLLRKQTAVGGVGLLGLQPATLLVPAEEEHNAELLMAAASRIVSSGLESDVTPWIQSLNLVVEARLPADAAYLIANGNQVDSLELGFIDGEEAPQFETKEGFEVDETAFKCRHVFEARFLDHRGIVKMPIV